MELLGHRNISWLRRKYNKRTKVNKEHRSLKAKQLGSYEEGKTVLQMVLLCFIVILADGSTEVVECHTDLEVVDLDSM